MYVEVVFKRHNYSIIIKVELKKKRFKKNFKTKYNNPFIGWLIKIPDKH